MAERLLAGRTVGWSVLVSLLVLGAVMSPPEIAAAAPDCQLALTPATGSQLSPGALVVGSAEVSCPPGTGSLDLYAAFAVGGLPGCPGDLLAGFVQADGFHLVCLGQLSASPPLPTVRGFAPGGPGAPGELVRLAWPELPIDPTVYWALCAVRTGGAFPGDMQCDIRSLTQVARPRGFTIGMPVLAGETANTFLGLWPFGVHGAGHTYDGGHPGWDIEYVPGASARAAADGTVQSVRVDPEHGGRVTVQVQHAHGARRYRTVYTNLENPTVAPGDAVVAGQALGRVGSELGRVGSRQVPYHVSHFQLDDLGGGGDVPGISNPYAVSPEPYLSAAGRAIFDALWAVAAYDQELTEPFASSPRNAPNPFPIRRTWTVAQRPQVSALPEAIEFTYADPASDPTPLQRHDYALLDAAGRVVERGSVRLEPKARPHSRIELEPRDAAGQPLGLPRLGVYDIVGGTLWLDFGAPGAPRPPSLAGAGAYTTR